MSEQHDFFANMTENQWKNWGCGQLVYCHMTDNKDKGYVLFDADGQGLMVGAPSLEAAHEYALANGAFPLTLH